MTDNSASPDPDGQGSRQFALPVSDAWAAWRARVDLESYNIRWDAMEAQGHQVHDEADLVDWLGGRVILDAGCGTGRVAAELSRRGRTVVGVDNDADMLAYANAKPEAVRWQLADLASVVLPERFDAAVMAGNILFFVEPGNRARVVRNLAHHLAPGGWLIAGSQSDPGLGFDDVDRWCEQAGLALVHQFATWDRQPFQPGGDYRVSVHQRNR